MLYIGEIAGLLTSLFFAINAIVISRAGKQVGSVVLNRTRVVFALAYLVVLNTLLFGQPLPIGAGAERWLWLGLSGLIGLAIGDAFLFQSYILVGPRIGSLLLSLATVFGVLEARLFFGELLRPGQIVGIALTLAGIIWVVLERQPAAPAPAGEIQSVMAELRPEVGRKVPLTGIIFGIVAAFGQATGLVFSRQGMQGSFSPISGNAIRMSAAVLALWLVAFFQRQARPTIQTLKDHPSALKLIALAALIGPVIGVSLSLLAVQNAPVGVASVLTSLSPVFILPFSHFLLKERLGWQPIAGTLLAMTGVIILFIS
ncbi:MAG TPA: DMT family transporter [Anaerolineales bacterium]|nr:DMT family transporter [Anaerolineales bacterium]